MPRKPIPDEVWEKIRRDWSSGVPVKVIADAYGYAAQTIYNKKSREGWDDALTDAEASIQAAKSAAESRVIDYINEAEVSMRSILDRHKRVSDRIASMLESAVTQVEEMEGVAPQKILHALKTASDVAASIQKHERQSWGMDEKLGVSSLEDFLEKKEGKLTVIGGGKG